MCVFGSVFHQLFYLSTHHYYHYYYQYCLSLYHQFCFSSTHTLYCYSVFLYSLLTEIILGRSHDLTKRSFRDATLPALPPLGIPNFPFSPKHQWQGQRGLLAPFTLLLAKSCANYRPMDDEPNTVTISFLL